ncbi:MAG: putative sugar nucleotidyl transferase [Candidatus Krumholzibacteria bacterium]|nr:putative sugar nucleotidyl transferase [Candidatus Krumholzibacteria bacterium]MDP6669349.1 putative sugar nucleotidyl transferase [Candidatus Krumholzibacteria bacterium]MDP6796237.1 putative sugar nucleotidyl transferase [Candidatus Krumholzibacteria bacterium]MDP7020988.1 putative sugar nucleotidyl transferase [Candidatus Krumholzibacteria bacterium]
MFGKRPAILVHELPSTPWLGPPVATRPVWDLQLGPFRIRDLFESAFPSHSVFFHESRLRSASLPAELLEFQKVLLIPAQQLPLQKRFVQEALSLEPGDCLEEEGRVLARMASASEIPDLLEIVASHEEFPALAGPLLWTSGGPWLRFWWELRELAAHLLENHCEETLRRLSSPTRLLSLTSDDVYRASDVCVADSAVIDTSSGPVILDQGVEIGALSYVAGPCYLGPGTRVRPSSRLLHGVIAGPQCRLGGELEESLFQGYANKQHDGFLGNAWVGEWVNLGAGTTNSDLKNNYSSVRVQMAEGEIDSSRMFLGACLGDHVRTGILSRLNTGTVFEPFVNWFGATFPPKYLPAFSWGDDRELQEYRIDKALETAAIAMSRRDCDLNEELEELYRGIHLRRSG